MELARLLQGIAEVMESSLHKDEGLSFYDTLAMYVCGAAMSVGVDRDIIWSYPSPSLLSERDTSISIEVEARLCILRSFSKQINVVNSVSIFDNQLEKFSANRHTERNLLRILLIVQMYGLSLFEGLKFQAFF